MNEEEERRIRAIIEALPPDKLRRLQDIIEADQWREKTIAAARTVAIYVAAIGGALAVLKSWGIDVLEGIRVMFGSPK